MKLWVDDVRPAPEGYVWCKSVEEAKNTIVNAQAKFANQCRDGQTPDTNFVCPVCGKVFGADSSSGYANVHIKECGYPEVYEGCLRKKEVWE